MAGGTIHYTKYSCPNCDSPLSNSSLIYSQEVGCCPVCKSPLKVDLSKTLPNTLETKVGEIVVLLCYFGLVALVLQFSGFDISSFINQSSPLVLVISTVVLLAPAGFLIKWFTQLDLGEAAHINRTADLEKNQEKLQKIGYVFGLIYVQIKSFITLPKTKSQKISALISPVFFLLSIVKYNNDSDYEGHLGMLFVSLAAITVLTSLYAFSKLAHWLNNSNE